MNKDFDDFETQIQCEEINWAETSSEGWVEFSDQFSCHGTEPDENTMVHKTDTGISVSKVSYGKEKKYFINLKAAVCARCGQAFILNGKETECSNCSK